MKWFFLFIALLLAAFLLVPLSPFICTYMCYDRYLEHKEKKIKAKKPVPYHVERSGLTFEQIMDLK